MAGAVKGIYESKAGSDEPASTVDSEGQALDSANKC